MNEMEKALKKQGIVAKKTGELEALLKIQKSLSFIKWQLIGLGLIIISGFYNLMDILKKIYFSF